MDILQPSPDGPSTQVSVNSGALHVLMSAALWGVGAWQVVDGNTTLGAMCIFVGGGAFFVTVAWLRHGREGGESGFVEFVIGFLTQGP